MPIENITLPDYDFLQPIQGELKKLINLHGSVTQQLDTLFRLIANRAGPDEKIVIDTMLRQILKLHDSIPPLIMFGKTDVIEIVSRSILDLIFQFLFISKGDANLKALCYLYCVNRNNLADIEKLYKPQFKEYSNYIGFNEENSSIDEATIKQEKNRLEILLLKYAMYSSPTGIRPDTIAITSFHLSSKMNLSRNFLVSPILKLVTMYFAVKYSWNVK